jgi:hypothetical protein
MSNKIMLVLEKHGITNYTLCENYPPFPNGLIIDAYKVDNYCCFVYAWYKITVELVVQGVTKRFLFRCVQDIEGSYVEWVNSNEFGLGFDERQFIKVITNELGVKLAEEV